MRRQQYEPAFDPYLAGGAGTVLVNEIEMVFVSVLRTLTVTSSTFFAGNSVDFLQKSSR